MPRVTLDCLIVREPYASLIAYGPKRWELRFHPCKKRATIGIIASRRPPIPINSSVAASHSFPQGALLAIAKLSNCRKVTSQDLLPFINGHYRKVRVHDVEFETCEPPLGEPVDDVIEAANDDDWECYAWQLTSVVSLKKPKPIRSKAHSTWQTVKIDLEPKEFHQGQTCGGQSTLDSFH